MPDRALHYSRQQPTTAHIVGHALGLLCALALVGVISLRGLVLHAMRQTVGEEEE